MNLLAIDTSSDACSVALQVGKTIRERHKVDARQHTGILIPMIVGLLDEASIGVADLTAIVLGNGPGSFIGMRIGASVAQGICYGAGLKIVPVSSLAAIAAEAIKEHGADKVLVAQDARMHEVYVGRFARDSDGLPVAIGDEQICKVGRIEDLDAGYVAAGAAWARFPELFAENQPNIEALADIRVPQARHLLASGGAALAAGGAVDPENLTPAYIRVKVAEIPA